jgi:small subunit ribosomal protein S3
MGQKVHPKGLRVGIIKGWDSKWYAGKKDYVKFLHEDVKLRKFIKQRFFAAGISGITIERAANRVKVTIRTAKPGMVIGKGGTGVEELRRDLEAMTGKHVSVNIVEIKVAETDAQLVAENIASALERRVSFRRAMKQAVTRAMRMGAKGCRVVVSGRLGGAEMSRTERAWEGTGPLHTLRADIDYGFAEAFTTYGQIGVKVWVYRGEVLPDRKPRENERKPEARAGEAN